VDSRASDIKLLQDLISIRSYSGEENEVAEFLAAEMARRGFSTRRDAAGNAIGVLGDPNASERIVLLGHMDTVPGWIPVLQDGDRLYGRGAVDAKGPLAVFVLAAARVAARLSDTCLIVIGAAGEEATSPGAHHLALTMPAPACSIIGEPSGWSSITLGYKGVLAINYRLTQASGHSANGEATPAEEAIDFWNRVVEATNNANQGESWRFTTIDPSLREIHSGGDGLEDWVEMRIRLRLPPGLDISSLQGEIASWAGAAEVRFPYSDPAVQSEKNTPLVRAFLRGIRAAGGRPTFKLKTGSSDMNVVGPTWSCPIVAYGPGNSSLDHTPEEHIEIPEFLRSIDVLVHALEQLLH